MRALQQLPYSVADVELLEDEEVLSDVQAALNAQMTQVHSDGGFAAVQWW